MKTNNKKSQNFKKQIFKKKKLYQVTVLEVRIQRELDILLAKHDAHLPVLVHPLLEEVGLPLQGDGVHEVDRIRHVVHLKHV